MEDIVCFQADIGIVFDFHEINKKHIMLQTVFKETETFLDLKKVFRINEKRSIRR